MIVKDILHENSTGIKDPEFGIDNASGKDKTVYSLFVNNSHGCCVTIVDLQKLIAWIKKNKPELLE